MSLHMAMVSIEGDHRGAAPEIFDLLDYKIVGTPALVQSRPATGTLTSSKPLTGHSAKPLVIRSRKIELARTDPAFEVRAKPEWSDDEGFRISRARLAFKPAADELPLWAQDGFNQAVELAAISRRVDALIYLHQTLKLWLAPHVLATSLMLALMLVHIIQVIYFAVR